jgi:hypothetical protein
MKTITVVHLSEYKKLNPFEKKMIRFFQGKSWLFGLIPISLFLMVWLCASLHNFWYLIPYFMFYFFAGLLSAEKYGKVSTTTEYCGDCNSKLKYLGEEPYGGSYWYHCPKCKKDIEC